MVDHFGEIGSLNMPEIAKFAQGKDTNFSLVNASKIQPPMSKTAAVTKLSPTV